MINKTITITVFLASLAASQAAIVAPYTADADTLHLYHLDEGSGANVTSDSAGTINPSKQNGATLGNAGFTGFGNAGNTSAASNSIIRSSVVSPGLIAPPAGADGAFTYEAMINISTTLGSQQIFSMDSNNGINDRPFWFRITNGDLQFKDIGNGNYNNNAAIPTTGIDAFVANEWFHVAVTYDGNANVADNLNFFWTRVDDSRTKANLIGSGILQADLRGTAVYGIGNAFRTVGSGVTSNLEGSIDEVRISGIARGAGDMLFVPEPSTFTLVGLSSLALLLRRRR